MSRPPAHSEGGTRPQRPLDPSRAGMVAGGAPSSDALPRKSRRLNPETAFPEEVLALRDAGIPLPSWYVGPLYTGTPESEAAAMAKLDAVRRDLPIESGDEDVFDDWHLMDDRPTVGYCSWCGEARQDFYTCRDGGFTIPKDDYDNGRRA